MKNLPPPKGEGGERSEPGGVVRANLIGPHPVHLASLGGRPSPSGREKASIRHDDIHERLALFLHNRVARHGEHAG